MVPIVAGDDGVLHDGAARRDRAHAELADRDPRAARQLEVLGGAPVEHDAARGDSRVREPPRVARGKKPLVVERDRAHDSASLPVTRRDVRTADTHLELPPRARDGDQLQLAPWRGETDDARAIDREVHRRDPRRGLGRSPGRDERDARSGTMPQGEPLEALPRALRQRRRRIEEELELGEEERREGVVLLERGSARTQVRSRAGR